MKLETLEWSHYLLSEFNILNIIDILRLDFKYLHDRKTSSNFSTPRENVNTLLMSNDETVENNKKYQFNRIRSFNGHNSFST